MGACREQNRMSKSVGQGYQLHKPRGLQAQEYNVSVTFCTEAKYAWVTSNSVNCTL